MATALVERIHNLPPEVFNQVQDLVFDFDCKQAIHVGPDYRFPVQLHVDSGTRRAVAKKYLTNSTFTFPTWDLFFKFAAAAEEAQLMKASNLRILNDTLSREQQERWYYWGLGILVRARQRGEEWDLEQGKEWVPLEEDPTIEERVYFVRKSKG